MDYDRPTEDLKLPDAGATLILYANMTSGDFRKIQRALISKMKVTIDPNNPGASKVRDISGEVAMDQEDAVLKCLLVKIVMEDGTEVENMKKFIYNLSMQDGTVLFDRLNEISAGSSMEKSRKKE